MYANIMYAGETSCKSSLFSVTFSIVFHFIQTLHQVQAVFRNTVRIYFLYVLIHL